mmetsp:Transcript_21089/g.23610  ORF Transcript_21089/g.23610 Transcript_21089/m.23610 type:complete len:148 (-) Transcript_21089:192-635(-)
MTMLMMMTMTPHKHGSSGGVGIVAAKMINDDGKKGGYSGNGGHEGGGGGTNKATEPITTLPQQQEKEKNMEIGAGTGEDLEMDYVGTPCQSYQECGGDTVCYELFAKGGWGLIEEDGLYRLRGVLRVLCLRPYRFYCRSIFHLLTLQ